MLRIIVSRGLDPDTGVGKAADRTPTVYIFLDAKGTRIRWSRSPWLR